MRQEPSHLTQAIIAELETLSQSVTQDVSERSKARKTLAGLLKAMQDNDIDAAKRLFDSKLDHLVNIYPETKEVREKLRIDLNRGYEGRLRQIYSQLESYCQAEGISLTGKPPKYMADHFLEIEFDSAGNRVKVGTQNLNNMKWDRVRDTLISERQRLWGRAFNAAGFRDGLLAIARNLARGKPGVTGGWIPLEEIYQTLKRQREEENPAWNKGGRLVAYYKDEFGADLSKLWREQSLNRLDAPHIELSAIRDPRKAYKVLQPDSTVGLFGFLRSRKA